jgi:hypothetical protein
MQLVVIEVETVATVELFLAHSAAVDYARSVFRLVLVDARHEDIQRVHEGSATAWAATMMKNKFMKLEEGKAWDRRAEG